MVIEFGTRKINVNLIREIEPKDITFANKLNYKLLISYNKSETELLSFYENKDERDEFIKKIEDAWKK